MRWREAVMQVTVRVIASEEFHRRTRDRVAHEIDGEDLAIKFAAVAEQPRQADIKREVQQRVVYLRGMDGRAVRGVIAGKPDRPRQFTRAPKAATVHQAADAPEH